MAAQNHLNDLTRPSFFGSVPGVTPEIQTQIGKTLQIALDKKAGGLRVVSMRALPTSRTEIVDGFQFVANATVLEGSGRRGRERVLDSVVTLGHKNRKLVLREVKVPSLGTRVEA